MHPIYISAEKKQLLLKVFQSDAYCRVTVLTMHVLHADHYYTENGILEVHFVHLQGPLKCSYKFVSKL